MKRTLKILGCAMLLIAAAPPEPVWDYRVTPPPGKVQSVTPGEVMVEARNYSLSPGAILLDDPATPDKLTGRVQFRPGQQLESTATRTAFKACSQDAAVGSNVYPPCLIDDDGNGAFDRMAENDMAKAYPMSRQVRYERVAEIARPITNGLMRRLLYQGVSNGELKIAYREFRDGIARDPFSEELSIPLGDTYPQQVAVKGLVVTIHKIGPLGMEYELTSDPPVAGWGETP